jgi:glycyl-tRNA synthetase
MGFAKSRGVDPSALQIREVAGGRYAVAVVSEKGRPSVEVLTETLAGLVAAIKFGKTMRWNHTNVAFSRPVRWLLALHGESALPFEYAGLRAGNHTRSLRFRDPETVAIPTPADYFTTLEAQGIILDVEKRKQTIRAQVTALATEIGGTIPDDPGLLDEVTHLVEAPTAFRGSFDESYLALPREVLISVMRKHQRYFPVESSRLKVEGQPSPFTLHPSPFTLHPSTFNLQPSPFTLQPYFIAVRNGDAHALQTVTEGNEHVIRARFADANFFVRNDQKRTLEEFLPQLDSLTFQAKLGSMLDKTRRIEDLIIALAPKANLSPDEETTARRAAHLCKADLATEMVVEMTSLQGTMGKTYALRAGEPAPVAEAIFEHYLPRSAGDIVPKSRAGLVIGIADRLDSLVGLFAAGLAPTGNKDPFGLRRAALGLCQLLIAWDLDFDLRSAVRSAARRHTLEVGVQTQTEVLDFITGRLRSMLLDEGYKYDAVEAVLAAQSHNPARAVQAIKELTGWIARPDWGQILPSYSRCVRITRPYAETFNLQPSTFADPAEHGLYTALLEAEANLTPGTSSPDTFLNAFLPMQDAVSRFFDAVLVMAEEETIRNNRLGLLQRIAALASGVADMSKLEGF